MQLVCPFVRSASRFIRFTPSRRTELRTDLSQAHGRFTTRVVHFILTQRADKHPEVINRDTTNCGIFGGRLVLLQDRDLTRTDDQLRELSSNTPPVYPRVCGQ
jgi:hypothetical protein